MPKLTIKDIRKVTDGLAEPNYRKASLLIIHLYLVKNLLHLYIYQYKRRVGPQYNNITSLATKAGLNNIRFRPYIWSLKERSQRNVYYTSPQSFKITFSYSLT